MVGVGLHRCVHALCMSFPHVTSYHCHCSAVLLNRAFKVHSSEFYFHKPNNCAHRTIFLISFHSFFTVRRSVLTVENFIKVKAQRSFKKFHL